MNDLTTWRNLIAESAGDDVIISCTLDEIELDRPFDDGFGSANGKPFTAWSEIYVYFPVCYDGCEFVGRAPRNPCDEEIDHIGG